MADERPENHLVRALEDHLIQRLTRRIEEAMKQPAGGDQRPPPAALPPGLRQVHRRLLEHATLTPTPAKRLIASAGYKLNGWSRAAVAELVRRGLLVRVPEGVRLPGQARGATS